MSRALAIASLVGSTLLLACGGSSPPLQPADQLRFGVDMARQGLWSEAYFRFEQATRLGADDAGTWNNMAVAAEALGRFDEALEHYQKALQRDPHNRDLRHNYDRFSSFYESFRARTEEEGGVEDSTDSGEEGEEAPEEDAASAEEDSR
jgi:tetratricopeptide (TPR) repeat protein